MPETFNARFSLRYSFYSASREKKGFGQSSLAFIAPSQSQERLKRFGPDVDTKADWLLTPRDFKPNRRLQLVDKNSSLFLRS